MKRNLGSIAIVVLVAFGYTPISKSEPKSNVLVVAEIEDYRAALIDSLGTRYYQISFTYESSLKSVYLDEVGYLSKSAAKVKILSPISSNLVFRETKNGTVKLTVALPAPASSEGAGISLPSPDMFGVAFRKLNCPANREVDAYEILNRHFRNGYSALSSSSGTTLTTTFQRINLDDSPKFLEVAILLNLGGQSQCPISIATVVRERGRLSKSWSGEISEEGKKSAGRFFQSIEKQLEKRNVKDESTKR